MNKFCCSLSQLDSFTQLTEQRCIANSSASRWNLAIQRVRQLKDGHHLKRSCLKSALSLASIRSHKSSLSQEKFARCLFVHSLLTRSYLAGLLFAFAFQAAEAPATRVRFLQSQQKRTNEQTK